MYKLRTGKRRDYKVLNSGASMGETRRNSSGGLSSADTLVPEVLENTLSGSLDPQDCYEEIEQPDVSAKPFIPATQDPEQQPISTSRNDAMPPTDFGGQRSTNSEATQMEVRQHVAETTSNGSPVKIDHRVSIPYGSNDSGTAIISQDMSGRPLQRLGATTIQQIISLPAESFRCSARAHNRSLQPEQSYSQANSDSAEDSGDQHDEFSSDENPDVTLASTERRFRKKHGFRFDDFTMDPFEKPSIDPNADRTLLGEKYAGKFDAWLKSSPYAVWVTKCAAHEPYAVCKYSDCGHLFSYEGNPTSSNIITHLRRNHRGDFEMFEKKIKGMQPQKKSDLKSALSMSSKPFPFRPELSDFIASNKLKINQLNLFIETIIPFSTAEAAAFKNLLDSAAARGHDYIRSRKGLTSFMKKYEELFNFQMRETLSKSFNYNILLDMWSSSNQKSYLAVIVTFCPNLCGGKDKLTIQDITTNGTPNAHVIDFVDLSDGRRTGDNLRLALLEILGKFSIAHKISSITLDNGSSNISMPRDLDNDIRGGPGVNKEGGLVKIRCMNNVLNRVFLDVLTGFEKEQQQLLCRIDRLTSIIKNNIFIRKKFNAFTSRFISRYHQLSTFLKLTGAIRIFYFDKRLDGRYQLTPEDFPLFCYEPAELEVLRFFLRVTRLFYEYTMLLQDDTLNTLPSGIEYYTQIDDFFRSCEYIRNGSVEEKHLENAGLKEAHVSDNGVDKEIRNKVFSMVKGAYPKFQKYMKLAFAEPGYWVAHILQPFCKSGILSNFDEEFQQKIKEATERYVKDYCSHFHDQARENRKQRIQKSSTKPIGSRKHKYKVLKNLRKRQNQDMLLAVLSSKSEWELYLEEPIQNESSYLDYWVMNQDKYPTLFHLALSFYHTKLSTAGVDRCFSISRRALEDRFSLSSTNLKSTMILRNRLKCFGIGQHIQEVKDIPIEQWIEDEQNEAFSDRSSEGPAVETEDLATSLGYSSDSDLSDLSDDEE